MSDVRLSAKDQDPVFGVDGGALVKGIAMRIHDAVRRTNTTTSGQCKNASVALALALSPLKEPVAICHGTVRVDDVDHSHAWCRIAHTIIDATSDQFFGEGPLVAHETDMPHYSEHGFEQNAFQMTTDVGANYRQRQVG